MISSLWRLRSAWSSQTSENFVMVCANRLFSAFLKLVPYFLHVRFKFLNMIELQAIWLDTWCIVPPRDDSCWCHMILGAYLIRSAKPYHSFYNMLNEMSFSEFMTTSDICWLKSAVLTSACSDSEQFSLLLVTCHSFFII